MSRRSPYPGELRERAVRMVAEIRPDYPADWAAIGAVAAKPGIGSAETVRMWVSPLTHVPVRTRRLFRRGTYVGWVLISTRTHHHYRRSQGAV